MHMKIVGPVVLVLMLGLLFLFSHAQAPLPELIPVGARLSPPSPVEQGAIVQVIAEVRNVGTAPAGGFTTEISWRRVDKEELCGVAQVPLPGLGPGEGATVQGRIETAELTPGTYEVAIRVDVLDQVSEADETNNRALLELVVLPPKPELHPLSLSFDPPSPIARGATVRVSAEFENTGESTAGEFRVAFLYREVGAESWQEFGAALVPGLKRDESLQLTRTLDTATLPFSEEPKAYEIKFAVDVQGEVPEQDEGNNELRAFLTVVPSRLHLPELHLVNIEFNRDLPLEWGRDLQITVTVINTGGSRVTNPFVVEFAYRRAGTAEWQSFAEVTVTKLGVEEGEDTTNVSATLDAPGLGLEPGGYEVRVRVDAEQGVSEQNENNNELIFGFSISGSELHPLSFDAGATPVHQGDTVTVRAEIENSGVKPAPRFTVGFFIDNLRFDTFYYESQAEGLRRGERVEAQGVLDTTDLPPGEYVLRVVVDPDDHIPEPDEANNVISRPLRILPPEPRRAELHPTRLVLEPPSPIRGGQVLHLQATVWNTGNIDAESFQVSFAYRQVDGPGEFHEFAVREVPALARNSKVVVAAELDTRGLTGDLAYELRVSVDPREQVVELDEQNNVLFANFKVLAVPPPVVRGADLVLRELVLQPGPTVSQGTPLQVCVTVANIGQGPASEFTVEFRYRPAAGGAFTTFASQRVAELAVGAETRVCATLATASLALGDYELEIVVDPENLIGELNEENNTLSGRFTVTRPLPRPELYPASLSFDPPSPVTQGQAVQVCVEIANLSGVSAGSFSVAYTYLVNGAYIQFAIATVAGLGGGERLTLCRVLETAGLAPGVYEIRVQVDPENRVVEQNEANNELKAYLTITIPGPPAPQIGLSTGAAIRLLALDPVSGAVYAAAGERLYALDRGPRPKPGFPFTAAGAITALVLDTGAPRAAYLGTAEKLYAVSLEDGHKICEQEAEQIKVLTVDRFGDVYAGTASGLLSFTASCEPRWEEPVLGAPVTAVATDTVGVIYATAGARLYALDRSGEVRWGVDLPAEAQALAVGPAIYLGLADGEVLAYSAAGRQLWSYALSGPVTALALDRERERLYAVTNSGLYALGLDGHLEWSFTTASAPGAPAIDGRSGALFLGTEGGELHALRADGTEIFAVTIGSPIRSRPAIDAVVQQVGGAFRLVRTVYFGAEDGNLYLIRVTAELNG